MYTYLYNMKHKNANVCFIGVSVVAKQPLILKYIHPYKYTVGHLHFIYVCRAQTGTCG